jgi:hypothetical protein
VTIRRGGGVDLGHAAEGGASLASPDDDAGGEEEPDRSVAVVHVEDERYVLTAGAEQISCDPCGRCRVVDPPWHVEPCLRHSVRMGRHPTGAPGERSEEGEERSCRGSRGAFP